MKRKFFAAVVLLSVLAAGCDKARTLERAERLAIELRLYNRNIAQVTNEFYRQGKIAAGLHLGVIKACDGFSRSLDGTDRAIAAAKLITDRARQKSTLDFIERLFDTEVFTAFVGIVDAVVDVPADVKAKIESILASIRLVFSTIRALFADAHVAIREDSYA